MELEKQAIEKEKVSVLFREYERRLKLNPRYSKRAFARDLGVSHTLISLMETGKRQMSSQLARRLYKDLGLPKSERDILALGLPAYELKVTRQLSLDEFHLIADWVNYAILSLTETKGFHWTPEFIAERLGISPTKAEAAMRRLERLKLIECDEQGQYQQSGHSFVMENKVSTQATRKFNKELLEKAVEAMETLPMELRDLSSITLAMDPSFVPYALQKIREFRRSLCAELEGLGEKKEVYTLSTQIFPLSRKEKEE